MTRRFEVSLAHAVTFSLIFAIVLVTLTLGSLAYGDLESVILQGFDRKLKAISTTTASFIDADTHRRLERPSDMLGLTFDHGRSELLGFDALDDRLVTLDTSTGLAELQVPVALDEVAGLAFDSKRGYPVVLASSGLLLRIDRERARDHQIGDIGRHDCLGLAYVADADVFYCAAERTLMRIDPTTAEAEAVGSLGGLFRWLAPGPPGWLWAFDIETRGVHRIALPEPESAKKKKRRRSRKAEPPEPSPADEDAAKPDEPDEPHFVLSQEMVAGGVRGLAAGPGGEPVWIATDRLVRLGDDGHVPLGLGGFRSEQSLDYQFYIDPMRHIRGLTGIKFLYTQIPHEDPGFCIYILDSTLGEDRSQLGDVDEVAEETVAGQHQALSRGEVFLSSVQDWNQWGLLKVALAPIQDRRGESTALAGADVDISIIRDKTQAGLLRVLATGALSLVIGLLVAIEIARRITGPVAKVKETALALAAGRFSQSSERASLIELRRLSSALGDVGDTLESTMTRLETRHGALEHRRCLREMSDHLQDRDAHDAADAELVFRHHGLHSTSGVVAGEAGTLAWFSPPAAHEAEATRRRHVVGRVLSRQLNLNDSNGGHSSAGDARAGDAEEEGEAPWQTLFPEWIEGFVFRPRGSRRLEWQLRQPLAAFQIRPSDSRPSDSTLSDSRPTDSRRPSSWQAENDPAGRVDPPKRLLSGVGSAELPTDGGLLITPAGAALPGATSAGGLDPVSADAGHDDAPEHGPAATLDRWLGEAAEAPAGLYLFASAVQPTPSPLF